MNIDLSFWRDSTGHEVDCILEQGTATVPVEIKSGLFQGAELLAQALGRLVGSNYLRR